VGFVLGLPPLHQWASRFTRLWFLVFGFWLFASGTGPAGEPETRNQKPETAAEQWRVILEPKAMHRVIAWEIPGAQRTVLAPVVAEDDDYVYPSQKAWEGFHVDRAEIERRGAVTAAADLATLKPRYERNKKQVIQYAELTSDRPIVCSAVLAPKFLELFRDTLGDKVLFVVPNRFTAYVFPALASNYQDYYPMVFEAYKATAWPVSVEVFEVGPEGMRTVGVYQSP
jgi:hypothetical protein